MGTLTTPEWAFVSFGVSTYRETKSNRRTDGIDHLEGERGEARLREEGEARLREEGEARRAQCV